jgi:hypothetical protein
MLKIHVIKSTLFTHVNTVLYITKTDALCLDQNKLIFILFNYGLLQSNPQSQAPSHFWDSKMQVPSSHWNSGYSQGFGVVDEGVVFPLKYIWILTRHILIGWFQIVCNNFILITPLISSNSSYTATYFADNIDWVEQIINTNLLS